ncbi:MAG TPA: hypothetical protein DCK95_12855 [Anaerolineaceae bacterium]|uniref:Phosphoenolpyruvate synthase n=1 Tax=Anaerolinea thermophila TaxID=167964 RepID=A0A101FYB4_9CHLR|nr:MAG: hypothetical protein XD73_0525 [Anaerolinea thermophila]HAF63196.1 hypothetical protein [Anaerolineaceae bacterium]
MQDFSNSTDRLMSITLAIGHYPILSDRIRHKMREELFRRNIITQVDFESEVREKAIQSQQREGVNNPVGEEPADIWEKRATRVRDQLTDLLFSQHFSYDLFQEIVTRVLVERGVNTNKHTIDFNPELAPQELVFEHAWSILRLPAEEQKQYYHHLEESIVVLIRTMISDQLPYINIAKHWFTIQDLSEIRKRKIGTGRIGGKAAGMLLAHRILENELDDDLKPLLAKPEYFFIGSNEQYSFITMNRFERWNDQKYKSEEQMREDYPKIVDDFLKGNFPTDILEKLEDLLQNIGDSPLIVRSSSLLEDSFGTSFAGKYDSFFLPNQGSYEENLLALTEAITRVWASTLNPNALLYRRKKGLQDYDERMAILIMRVEGEHFGKYYMPDAAGVAFSRNLYRWAPQIRREDGFVRIVWGLGTRAVDRVGNDYPRLIALSHPLLRPMPDFQTVERCSQKYVDLIDIEKNEFETLPIQDVIDSDYIPLKYIAQLREEGYFAPMHSRLMEKDRQRIVLTFDELLRKTNLATSMRKILQKLEKNYNAPVDLEFTMNIDEKEIGKPTIQYTILQCRPQSHLSDSIDSQIPSDLEEKDILFSTYFMVPQGTVQNISYALFVQPEEYYKLDETGRFKLARSIGQLNAIMEEKQYVLIGPGRWGSTNTDLGVPVAYSDIFNTAALIELSGKDIGAAPEPSLGTHFFQDLLEAQIYPLAILVDDPENAFQKAFFYHAPNHIGEFLKVDEEMKNTLRLLAIADYRKGNHLKIIMDEEKSYGVGFLEPDTDE